MDKEEQLFRKRMQELARTAYNRDVPVHTDFLNLNEQAVFQSISGSLPSIRYEITGGYEMAERKVVCFLPSYEEVLTEPPFKCLKIAPVNVKFAEELTHRDYLGAVMNLGIEREMTGDILINGQEACIFVMDIMADYVMDNLVQIRRTSVSVTLQEDLPGIPGPDFEEITGSLSSVRLDSVVALAGRLSRGKAAALIEGEKVALNGQITVSAAKPLKEGDILSVRGLGKFRYAGTGTETKKGRIMVTVWKYK